MSCLAAQDRTPYESRSIRAVGLTPGNHRLEVLLPRDGRAEGVRCIVFPCPVFCDVSASCPPN